MTIALETENKIRKLSGYGLSQREISRRIGVSRDTVRRVVIGEQVNRQSKRCPECGALVFMPCRACKVRSEFK
mgnify:CR=1 FL=1